MSRKVYSFGETIYDMIFENGELKAGKAGGSSFNASISLARAGIDVAFVGEVGDDKVGDITTSFLTSNGVSTKSISRGGKSNLALAFLDHLSDAEYLFYKSSSENSDYIVPQFSKDDIILFGSFFALDPKSADYINRVVEAAKSTDAIIYYDINFRASHIKDRDQVKKQLMLNIEQADIVRGSDEDLLYGLKIDSEDQFFNLFPENVLIQTKGADGVKLSLNRRVVSAEADSITPISTIGAGDSFNAGFIYSLVVNNIGKEDLSRVDQELWKKIIKTAVSFSSEVCLSFDNYISEKFAAKL